MTSHDPKLVSAPIVVGVDGTAGDLAVRWAAETAARRKRRLLLVHAVNVAAAAAVFGPYAQFVPPVTTAMRDTGAELLARARELAVSVAPEVEVETESVDGSPGKVLIDRSATAHMTVLGATGTGGTLAHLGSTLIAVASHAAGTVVVVRGANPTATQDASGQPLPVVVGVDGSEYGRAAVEVAFAEAAEREAPLVAVHSWTDLPAEGFFGLPPGIEDRDIQEAAHQLLAEQMAGGREKYPDLEVTTRTYLSGPRKHLREWSERAQLVVTGSRGRGGFRGLLLGSTSNDLVQNAHCPVMVVHPRK
ncbi:universal stress protein [Nocardia farcinica]|uniref:universal stress protein n=1 Tax=Nocardia farcinica TaxID=37329 RepID=UPI002456E946|nr:universal stress protein [Nocardia farcinica]